MTKNTVNEKERMVITRVFDAPRELGWKTWTDALDIDLARLDPTSLQEDL